MRCTIRERVKETAKYIIATDATVREAARHIGVSKSTVHKDVTKRLCKIDIPKFVIVRAILFRHKRERHLRGGEATRRKYAEENARGK